MVTVPVSVARAAAVTASFAFTGAEQSLTVPAGVTSVHVLVVGAPGAAGSGPFGGHGGSGAQVSADLPVVAGEILFVEVGGTGGSVTDAAGPGGFNGGGAGVSSAGGGGGASDVRAVSVEAAGSSDSRLIIAAGGGGGGADGVFNGAFVGGDGGSAGGAGGAGATPNTQALTGGTGGGAAGPLTGGAGGPGGLNVSSATQDGLAGGAGQVGAGGTGGQGGPDPQGQTPIIGGGGGGGGGEYGGGAGGGGGCCLAAGGGGGGGSSYVPAAAANPVVGVDHTGVALVQITYAAPALATSGPVAFAGTQPLSTISFAQPLTITNNGSATALISGLTFAGADPGDFLLGSQGCLGPVPAGASCTVAIRFTPQAQGARTATLVIAGNDPAGPLTVALSGTGGQVPQAPAGATGSTGPAGPVGPTGATGPAGAPGQIELVTCVAKSHIVTTRGRRRVITIRSCRARLVSGTVRFTTTSTPTLAVLSRRDIVYATGRQMSDTSGRSRLILHVMRPLISGRYRLMLRSRHGRRWVTRLLSATVSDAARAAP
jgi:hypothetical protein